MGLVGKVAMDIAGVKEIGDKMIENINRVVIGKEEQVRLAVTALFAAGHILLEDVPGSGKTMLAKCLAKSIDGSFRRIQFTPDLLPADLTGINYFNRKKSEFEFIPGPVFTNILLADEINRATPKTQAGLLECMEERQVTVDGKTMPLGAPYLVIATQNPVDTQGVFPLPEAQLDRFLVRFSLGYPDFEDAISIMKIHKGQNLENQLNPVVSTEEIACAQSAVAEIEAHEDILRYIVKLTEATRSLTEVRLGISQRGGMALLRFSKAYAALQGRAFVIPDDVKAGVIPVFSHRLLLSAGQRIVQGAAKKMLMELMEEIPAPTEII